jgi:hypothetical protein
VSVQDDQEHTDILQTRSLLSLLTVELAIVAAVGHGWAQGAKLELFTLTRGDLALKGFVRKPEGPRSISSDRVESRQRKAAGHR